MKNSKGLKAEVWIKALDLEEHEVSTFGRVRCSRTKEIVERSKLRGSARILLNVKRKGLHRLAVHQRGMWMDLAEEKLYRIQAKVQKETEKAIQIRTEEGDEAWIPKVLVDDKSEIWKEGDEGELAIPINIAEEKELV